MEKFNPQEYRDNLAKKLKDVRNSDPDNPELARAKAQEYLKSKRETEEYQKAKIKPEVFVNLIPGSVHKYVLIRGKDGDHLIIEPTEEKSYHQEIVADFPLDDDLKNFSIKGGVAYFDGDKLILGGASEKYGAANPDEVVMILKRKFPQMTFEATGDNLSLEDDILVRGKGETKRGVAKKQLQKRPDDNKENVPLSHKITPLSDVVVNYDKALPELIKEFMERGLVSKKSAEKSLEDFKTVDFSNERKSGQEHQLIYLFELNKALPLGDVIEEIKKSGYRLATPKELFFLSQYIKNKKDKLSVTVTLDFPQEEEVGVVAIQSRYGKLFFVQTSMSQTENLSKNAGFAVVKIK